MTITSECVSDCERRAPASAQSLARGEGTARDPIESQGMKGYETISRAAVDFGQREAAAATHTIDERINR